MESLTSRGTRSCPVCGQAIAPTPGITPVPTALMDAYNTHLRSLHPDFLVWEKSKFKYGAMVGAILAVAVTVPIFYFGIYVFHLPSSFGRGLGFVPFLAFILPIVLINKRGARRFAVEWQNLHGTMLPQQSLQPQPIEQSTSDSRRNDQALLQATSDLTTQLGITGFIPEMVVWRNTYPIGNSVGMVPSDQCIIRGSTLYFAENMKGKLEPEDWKPIIASALVYNKKIHDRILTDLLIRIIPVVAVYLLGWFLIPPLFPTVVYYNPDGTPASTANNGWFIMILAGFALLLGMIPVTLYWLRGLKLKADKEAAKVVGTVQFVQSLKKIGQESPSDAASVIRRVNKLESTG